MPGLVPGIHVVVQFGGWLFDKSVRAGDEYHVPTWMAAQAY